MKAFKLILIFVVILGGVMGAFLLINDDGEEIELNTTDTTYETYRQKFKNDWKARGDWDDSLFISHCYTVKQLSKKKNVSALKDLNTRTATEMVYQKIFEQWKSKDCKKAVVDRYIKALNTIEREDVNAKNDRVVKEIRSVYKTYTDAYVLVHRSFKHSPNFDGTQWQSYVDFEKGIMDRRAAIMKQDNYKSHLSNISELKDGLDDIPGELAKVKVEFYHKLADELITHYSQTPPNKWSRAQLNELRNHKGKFESEYTSNTDLSNFTEQYSIQVTINSSSNR